MELKIKALSDKLGKDIPFPAYATPGSAGMDLRACIDSPVTILPGEQGLIPTGLAIKHGLSPANCVGVIDSDYRGEVVVALRNYAGEPYTVEPGERVAQLVLTPVTQAAVSVVDSLDETQRGEGGFGSTGRN